MKLETLEDAVETSSNASRSPHSSQAGRKTGCGNLFPKVETASRLNKEARSTQRSFPPRIGYPKFPQVERGPNKTIAGIGNLPCPLCNIPVGLTRFFTN
jgi:hypothetical protein